MLIPSWTPELRAGVIFGAWKKAMEKTLHLKGKWRVIEEFKTSARNVSEKQRNRCSWYKVNEGSSLVGEVQRSRLNLLQKTSVNHSWWLSTEAMFQDPQWMHETTNSTKSHIHYIFPMRLYLWSSWISLIYL